MPKKIIFILNHPYDVILSLSFIRELNIKNVFFILLKHKYLNLDILNFLKKQNIDYSFIEKPDFELNLFKGFSKALKFKKKLNELCIGNYLIVSFSKFELYIDLINRYFNNHLSILQHSSTKEDFKNNELLVYKSYKFRKNIYEFLFQMDYSKPYKLKSTKSIIVFKKGSKNKEIFFSNNNFLKKNEITTPYRVSSNTKNKDFIYFFGSRFLEWEYFSLKHIELLNYFLDYLQNKFSDKKFIYVKHPLEKNETEKLNLKKFHILEDSLNAEMIFFERGNRIHSAYSIGSTSSKSAFEFGIQSFVIYKMFDFDDTTAKIYDRIFKGYPQNFFLKENKILNHGIKKQINLNNIKEFFE